MCASDDCKFPLARTPGRACACVQDRLTGTDILLLPRSLSCASGVNVNDGFCAGSLRDQASVLLRPFHVEDKHRALATDFAAFRCETRFEATAAARRGRQPCPVPPLRLRRRSAASGPCAAGEACLGKMQRKMWRVYFQSDAPKLTNETSKGPTLPLRSSLASSTAVREDTKILVRPSLIITVGNDARGGKIGSGILEMQLPPFKITSL